MSSTLAYLQDGDHFTPRPSPYLPVLVRVMMALAQHLKDDSTAPTATASEGSLVSWVCLLSPSNSCLWKVAASASRAIWAPKGRVGQGLLSTTRSTNTSKGTHPTGRDWQTPNRTNWKNIHGWKCKLADDRKQQWGIKPMWVLQKCNNNNNNDLSVKMVWFKCFPILPVTPSVNPCLALLSLFQTPRVFWGIPQGSTSG